MTWELLEDWGENPDISGPMAGSFHVKTDLVPQVGLESCPLESVSSVDVANMFAMELGYPTFDKVNEEISEVKIIDGRDFEWIRLNDKENEINL